MAAPHPIRTAGRRPRPSAEALTAPANLAIAGAVAAAAVILDAGWLLVVAVACYAGLTALTMRDERAAAGRAGPLGPDAAPALAPPVARRLEAGLRAADAVCAAIDESGVPLDDVAREVAGLRAAMTSLAVRADAVQVFLADHDPGAVQARLAEARGSAGAPGAGLVEALEAQSRALGRLRGQLDGLLLGIEHIVVALQAMHAEVLGMAAAEEGWRGRELESRVGELQAQVGALGDGLEDVYAETRVSLADGD